MTTWPESRLSPFQERLLELLAAGHTALEAGAMLHMTRGGVYSQCDGIKAAMGVTTLMAAVAVGIRSGVIAGPRPDEVVWRERG